MYIKSIKNKIGKYYNKEKGTVDFAHTELTQAEQNYFRNGNFYYSTQGTTEKKDKAMIITYHLDEKGIKFFSRSPCVLWIEYNSKISHILLTIISIIISISAIAISILLSK